MSESLLAKFNQSLQSINPNVTELDFKPDIHVENLEQLSLDELAARGVKHILLDCDGVFVDGTGRALPDNSALKFAQAAVADARFKSVDLATENDTNGPAVVAKAISSDVRIFCPHVAPDNKVHYKSPTDDQAPPAYYLNILIKLGAFDNPESVVMIGDSPYHDILPAQRAGMQTVLVESLISRQLPGFPERPSTE